MIKLPEDFITEIKDVLGGDAEKYLALSDSEPFKGISINRLKAEPEKLPALLGFDTEKSPFYADGCYIKGDVQGIGKHPLHHAGAFYVQEPSASSAVTLLDVHPGEKILDLCAAPGGKSAQIASCLRGRGMLWSNEVVKNRAQILLSNYERMGIANGVVSSCYPEILCEKLSGFFDKVLVDAPCSGEGMFRKNPEAAAEWSREHVISCAERQLAILDSASHAVKDGGTLVYSTCTFSHEENEGVITAFLEKHKDFEPCEAAEKFGRKTGVSCGIRITPLEGGEGHFAAKLRKKGSSYPTLRTSQKENNDKTLISVRTELSNIFTELPAGKLTVINGKAYIIPSEMPEINGAGVIRAGVFAGELKKNRFEPAHALFMASKPENIKRVLDLSLNDSRIQEYLSGCEIDCETDSGYTAVAVEGIVTGFGKCSVGRLKNKYPKGLRTL